MPGGRPFGSKDKVKRVKSSRPKNHPPAATPPAPTAAAYDPLKHASNEQRRLRLKLPAQEPASLKNATTRANLPHLFGWKWYAWAKAFFDSTNKVNLLVAGNQLSKSSSMIRKALHWSTDKKLWPTLWKTPPQIFWYLYPSEDVATIEFRKKWVPEFLPRAEMMTDPVYGWEPEWKAGKIAAIHFKSGVSIYFKTYGQKATVLQSATLHAVFADEELPEHFYDELKARLYRTDGYFNMVFTATLGQDLWRRAMEGKGENEAFPDAFKLQISMYDCLAYADGTPGPWTEARIKEIENDCKSSAEIQKRVMGRFVMESGRKYHTFDPDRHMIPPRQIPTDWIRFSGTDVGSGGQRNHPAACVFVAVNPTYTHGYVYRGWRGDGVQTSSGDVLDKYVELRGDDVIMRQFVDPRAKDFKIIAQKLADRVGAFEPADANHEFGEEVINTLFAHDMLEVFDTADGETQKLSNELMTLLKGTDKKKAHDDFCDASRYCVVKIPWDWSGINKEFKNDVDAPPEVKQLTVADELAAQIRERRGEMEREENEWQEFYDEIQEANESYG